jgi:fructokinase
LYDRQRIPTRTNLNEDLVGRIGDLIDQAEGVLGGKGTLGIGIPGAADPDSGVVMHAGNVGLLVGKPFVQDLGERLARASPPGRNDANCFALSEAIDGAGKGARTVFGVIIGTGCGGGLVFDGQVWPGANLIAGEWGHNAPAVG